MTRELLSDMLLWSMILNVGILALMSLMILACRDWICRVHGKMFGLAPETVSALLYGFLGAYKLGVFLFAIVPYVALQIAL